MCLLHDSARVTCIKQMFCLHHRFMLATCHILKTGSFCLWGESPSCFYSTQKPLMDFMLLLGKGKHLQAKKTQLKLRWNRLCNSLLHKQTWNFNNLNNSVLLLCHAKQLFSTFHITCDLALECHNQGAICSTDLLGQSPIGAVSFNGEWLIWGNKSWYTGTCWNPVHSHWIN